MGAFALWTDSVVPSAGTRAAPTATDDTEGMSLVGVTGFRVFVSADINRTLDGTGSVLFYLLDIELGRWVRDLELDSLITPTGATWANVRDICLADRVTDVRFGRVVAACSGVGVSAGGLTVRIRAFGP